MYGSKKPHIVDDPRNKCPGIVTIDDWHREVTDVLGLKFTPLQLKPWYRRLHYVGFQWQNVINPCIVFTDSDNDNGFDPYTSIRVFGFGFQLNQYEYITETK